MSCSNCESHKHCADAFTFEAQYCNNYNKDYEITKLLLKMMNMEDEYKETEGFRGGKKPENITIDTSKLSDVANLKIGEYQSPVTTTISTDKYYSRFEIPDSFTGGPYTWNVYCRYCPFNDGMIYTSYPPKYRCTITNEYHFGDETCNVNVPKMINDLKKENEFLKTIEKEFVKYVPTEKMGKIMREASKDVLGFDK